MCIEQIALQTSCRWTPEEAEDHYNKFLGLYSYLCLSVWDSIHTIGVNLVGMARHDDRLVISSHPLVSDCSAQARLIIIYDIALLAVLKPTCQYLGLPLQELMWTIPSYITPPFILQSKLIVLLYFHSQQFIT